MALAAAHFVPFFLALRCVAELSSLSRHRFICSCATILVPHFFSLSLTSRVFRRSTVFPSCKYTHRLGFVLVHGCIFSLHCPLDGYVHAFSLHRFAVHKCACELRCNASPRTGKPNKPHLPTAPPGSPISKDQYPCFFLFSFVFCLSSAFSFTLSCASVACSLPHSHTPTHPRKPPRQSGASVVILHFLAHRHVAHYKSS